MTLRSPKKRSVHDLMMSPAGVTFDDLIPQGVSKLSDAELLKQLGQSHLSATSDDDLLKALGPQTGAAEFHRQSGRSGPRGRLRLVKLPCRTLDSFPKCRQRWEARAVFNFGLMPGAGRRCALA
jgi:hypothetical protein